MAMYWTKVKCENSKDLGQFATFGKRCSTKIIVKHCDFRHTANKGMSNVIILAPIRISVNCNVLNIIFRWYLLVRKSNLGGISLENYNWQSLFRCDFHTILSLFKPGSFGLVDRPAKGMSWWFSWSKSYFERSPIKLWIDRFIFKSIITSNSVIISIFSCCDKEFKSLFPTISCFMF